jgi:hypothetical protein
MNPTGQSTANEIRAALARQGIVVDEDDIAAIVRMVETNRAGLARALAAVSGEPDVPQGFIPPAPPADTAPRPGR